MVKDELLPVVKEVQTSRTGVGVMGMGNKGAVAVRFRISDSSFCFVNSHLAAEMMNVGRRNQDFHDILQGTLFQEDGRTLTVLDHE
jgi:phosphatidylinositol-bisphosphatase